MPKPRSFSAFKASAGWSAGVQERGMYGERRQELARPHSILVEVFDFNQKEKSKMSNGESDQPIVLRDGRTDHMGKGLAGWWNRMWNQESSA